MDKSKQTNKTQERKHLSIRKFLKSLSKVYIYVVTCVYINNGVLYVKTIKGKWRQ